MTIVTTVVLALVFITSFISGVFGVAGGLILMGGLLYVLPVASAMLVHGAAQTVSNLTRVVLWWRYIDPTIVAWFFLGSIVSLAGFFVVQFVPSRTLVMFVMGLSIVTLSMVPDRWALKITHPGVAVLSGVLGMVLQLTSGASGTFLDQFFIRCDLDRRATIATKSAMQAGSQSMKVAYFAIVGGVTFDRGWWLTIAAVPIAAILANMLATLVLERMTDRQFYWWTRRIVLVIGLYFIGMASWTWLTG